jgi:hypothetical protein
MRLFEKAPGNRGLFSCRFLTRPPCTEIEPDALGVLQDPWISPVRDRFSTRGTTGCNTDPVLVGSWRFLKRSLRAVRLAAGDERIPRPLRFFLAFGLLPIPGPFDEAVLVLAAVPLGLFYRRPLVDAWNRAETEPAARSS